MMELLFNHPYSEQYIDLYQQWLDEPCPAIRRELKKKLADMESKPCLTSTASPKAYRIHRNRCQYRSANATTTAAAKSFTRMSTYTAAVSATAALSAW